MTVAILALAAEAALVAWPRRSDLPFAFFPAPSSPQRMALVAVRLAQGQGASIAVFRPATGQWLIKGHSPVRFGRAGDIPVPASYFRRGIVNIAVFRPATGMFHLWTTQWLILGHSSITWGREGDTPVPGTYFGTTASIAVFRPASGQWLIRGDPAITWGAYPDTPN